MDGKRVHTVFEFMGERSVYQAVALEPALALEGLRYDVDAKVRLPTGAMSGMADMLIGLVHHFQTRWSQGLRQLAGNLLAQVHGCVRRNTVSGGKYILRVVKSCRGICSARILIGP